MNGRKRQVFAMQKFWALLANPSEKLLIFTELRIVDIGCENVKGWLFFSLIVYWVRQSKFEILLELDDILFDLEIDFSSGFEQVLRGDCSICSRSPLILFTSTLGTQSKQVWSF